MSLPRKSRYLKLAPKGAPRPAPAPKRGPLVMVDAGPIRAAATKKYRQAQTRFADTQKALSRFQEKDKPTFERWLQQTFRGLVGELRAAQSKLADLRELVFEVETRTWFRNQSCAAAYRDILDRKARRQNGQDDPEPPDDLEEALRSRMKADEEEAEAERAEAEAAASSLPSRAGKKQLPPDREARLKAAYRSMARRLHPDRHGEKAITPQMRERWHAAQAAYLAGDVELLESLETLCLDEEDVDGETPVSYILARTGRLLASITQLSVKAQNCKKDPAWAFSTLEEGPELSRIERLMAKTLPVQLKTARGEIAELEAKIAGWRDDAERFYPGFKEAHSGKKGAPIKPAGPPQGKARAKA
ncbi:MAG: hypothetical protein PW734_02960 [Verrucomicrobium sp.]|nr:hypothetical protein [Verrucomicrobium sp.]